MKVTTKDIGRTTRWMAMGMLYYQGVKLAYQGNWSQDEFDGIGKVYDDNIVALVGTFDSTNFDYLEDYWEYYEDM